MWRTVHVLALAGMVSVAHGQVDPKNGIEIRVRPWGDTDPTHWVNSGTFTSPASSGPIEFEVECYYFRAQGYGLATVIHNITGAPYSAASGDSVQILDRSDSSLHPDGRVGKFNNGGQFQVVYHTGTAGVDAGRFRIAASGNAGDATAGGIAVKQNTPVALGTMFDTSDGAVGYHFRLALAKPATGGSRTFTIDAPLTGR